MKVLLVTWQARAFWRPCSLKRTVSQQESKAPFMLVSFTDLKWVDLPERKGMQFACISGDPKQGHIRKFAKSPPGPTMELHSHSSEITNVIIRGIWYTGSNSNWPKISVRASVVTMPADWVHVSGCRPGTECGLYQQGKGKFDFKPAATPGPDK